MQTFEGFAYAREYDIERNGVKHDLPYGDFNQSDTQLYRQHVLGMPRSF